MPTSNQLLAKINYSYRNSRKTFIENLANLSVHEWKREKVEQKCILLDSLFNSLSTIFMPILDWSTIPVKLLRLTDYSRSWIGLFKTRRVLLFLGHDADTKNVGYLHVKFLRYSKNTKNLLVLILVSFDYFHFQLLTRFSKCLTVVFEDI